MKRFFSTCGLIGALLVACGCGSSKPEVPSWFKGESKKDKGGEVNAKNATQSLQLDLKRKIQHLEKKQAALDEALASVDKSKLDLVARLHRKGVGSLEDLNREPFKSDDEVQRMKTSLLKNRQEFAKYQQMQKQYSIALFDGREALDSLERQLKLADAGISDKELEDLAVTIRKIDERLNATDTTNPVDVFKSDSELEKVLKLGK